MLDHECSPEKYTHLLSYLRGRSDVTQNVWFLIRSLVNASKPDKLTIIYTVTKNKEFLVVNYINLTRLKQDGGGIMAKHTLPFKGLGSLILYIYF